MFIILTFLIGYYAIIFEPNNIKIEKYNLIIENLPSSFNNLKIAHLSDFHSLRFGPREKKVLEMLEELKPEFVFITGDFVDPIGKIITDRELISIKNFWQKLGEKYKDKIFAVLGNHDTKIIKNYLEESGIVVLNNENKNLFLDKNEEFIYLIGVADPVFKKANLVKAMEDIEEKLPKILLAHGPEIMAQVNNKKIDLILVGHTHGGQVNIPILGKLLQPLSQYGRQYTKGLFKIDSTYLYVNRGIGTSFFPIRFASSPEITLIVLNF